MYKIVLYLTIIAMIIAGLIGWFGYRPAMATNGPMPEDNPFTKHLNAILTIIAFSLVILCICFFVDLRLFLISLSRSRWCHYLMTGLGLTLVVPVLFVDAESEYGLLLSAGACVGLLLSLLGAWKAWRFEPARNKREISCAFMFDKYEGRGNPNE